MAMKIGTCKTHLEARIKKLNDMKRKKNRESKQILKELPWEEYLKAQDAIDLFIRDTEVYAEELNQALEVINKVAAPEDKAEIVDKNEAEKRASEFSYDGFEFDETFVAVYRCIDFDLEIAQKSIKRKESITWVIGLMDTEKL